MDKSMRRGFTLIEMLVVIGVIVAVAMMLYPALNKSRESARSTRCVANLRNLHMATLNYTSDKGGLPPAVSYWTQHDDGTWWHVHGWVSWYTWDGVPSDGPTAAKPGDGSYAWRGTNGTAGITYGCLYPYLKSKEVFLCPSHAQASTAKDAVRSYSMNPAVSGASIFNVSGVASILCGDDDIIETSPYDTQFTTNEIAKRHNGQGNVVFVDGHIERR